MSDPYLNPGLPAPAPDGLDAPFWEALEADRLVAQRCTSCKRWQWGPEWICHRCHSDALSFDPLESPAHIYSYERVWHPVHPALKDQGPYLVVLVEFPEADGIRMVGNLLGDPEQDVVIGAAVEPVFEHHATADPPFTLLQWRTTPDRA